MLELRQITVSEFAETFFRAVQEISLIRRTMKNLDGRCIDVERSIRLLDIDPKGFGNGCVQFVSSFFAATSAPASLAGIEIAVVIDIQMVGDTDLLLVAGAFGL